MKQLLIVLAIITAIAGIVYLVNPPLKGFKMPSKVLKESRTILEYLPEDYDLSAKDYPVLIHLDADPHPSPYSPSFYDISKKINALGGPIPEMIVLGIVNTDRNRDMIPLHDPALPTSGGARHFLRFITDELIPKIKSEYRARDEFILYGRSDSGLFALYALMRAPDAFQGIIASSPTLSRCPDYMMKNMDRIFRERPGLSGTLFIIYGANEGPNIVDPIYAFAEAIQHTASKQFNMGVKRVPGEAHIPKSSLEDGLRFVFSVRAPFCSFSVN